MSENTLLLAWQSARESNERMERNTHDHCEVLYFLAGSGIFELNGESFPFSEGDFACIPPNTPHQTVHHTAAQVLYIRFTDATALPCALLTDSTGRVGRLLRDILRETREQAVGHTDMIDLQLQELAIRIQRCIHPQPTAKNLEYIVNYLKENYHEKLQLSDCARQLHISYDYFQHKFKELTGLSPQQFLMEQRLLAAEKLLHTDNPNCTAIAYRCGFSTSAQFSALFKARFGMPPLRYARTLK